ncbi:hypothetical protein CONPUDRAFT_71069 [Coniophora puteana RWD-64-598 SS2]|uniref:Uncharacterized protein n=1 Tax=Coniophora puteana (strain RWD-64-598) TaxID=741705 RepID=A0A5M3MZL8_CONPW|nr:uncharacterized protein CONPUDRAFT_71069 [Coniophora puteana RWD-64-598 SS2]EIW84254.1 hypothetical protein CONPUDRAFT_71069 [Coniophora puteana RWD-64-598 SS2]
MEGPPAEVKKECFVFNGHKSTPMKRSRSMIHDILRVRDAIKDIPTKGDYITTAKDVIDALKNLDPFENHEDKFHPVVYGGYVGIYTHWDDAIPEVTGRDCRRFRTSETFKDALVYMITKGRFATVVDLFHPDPPPQPPSPASPSPANIPPSPVPSPARARDPVPSRPHGPAPSLRDLTPGPVPSSSHRTSQHETSPRERVRVQVPTPPSLLFTQPLPPPENVGIVPMDHLVTLVSEHLAISERSARGPRPPPSASNTSHSSRTYSSRDVPGTPVSISSSSRSASEREVVPINPERRRVYAHERTLRGVVRTLHSPADVREHEDGPPSHLFTRAAVEYMEAQGFLPAARWSVWYAFRQANSCGEFIDYLSSERPLAELEAKYLWGLLGGGGLPRYLRTKTHTTTRRRFAKPNIPKTPQERAELKKRRRERKAEYLDALAEAQDIVLGEATKLYGRFGGHSIDYYVEAIMQNSRVKGGKRRVNRWNAHLSKRLRQFNDNVPEDGEHQTASEFAKQLKDEWAQLSEAERIELTKEDCADLEELRASKNAVHSVPLAAWRDAKAALKHCTGVLGDLASRTSVKILLVAVRDNTTQLMRPFTYTSDESVDEFFDAITNSSVETFATRLEACLVSKYRREVVDTKKELVTTINTKLYEATKVKFSRTPYSQFDKAVTEKYGIVVDGLPPGYSFQNPSGISSSVEVLTLLGLWNSGVVSFREMSRQEWESWREKRFQEAMSQMETDEGQSPSTPPDDSAVAPTTSAAIAPQSQTSPAASALPPINTPVPTPVPTPTDSAANSLPAPMNAPAPHVQPVPGVSFQFVNSFAGPDGHQRASGRGRKRKAGC